MRLAFERQGDALSIGRPRQVLRDFLTGNDKEYLFVGAIGVGFDQAPLVDFRVVLELVGYFHAYYPGLVFDRELVQRLARYSLSVDFDFYDLAAEE